MNITTKAHFSIHLSLLADTDCVVADDNTGLSLDVVCFVFLLLQRKIYTSHYFRHVVADFEAQNRLASRSGPYYYALSPYHRNV
ncbi:hypothetical protein DPMN_169620 [Dreissena polymorpha]|uniref:Piezo TM25-28 domain-containing protein n=1 Tax=Dreissena polymorpha TaxID=45954 RepID=A0A9D4IDT0_DREPO|nr:hypothetical protein DPMN_169620 [Dreissena polymorpha]